MGARAQAPGAGPSFFNYFPLIFSLALRARPPYFEKITLDAARSRGLRERFPGLLVLADGSGDASAVFSLFFEKNRRKKERAPFAKTSVLSLVNKCLPWPTAKVGSMER